MTANKIKRQYGLWESPISPISVARGISLSNVLWDQSGDLVWHEWRSDRGVLVVKPGNPSAMRDLNSEYSVRGRVGYGGGDFAVDHGIVYFAEATSGRLYRQPLESGQAQPVTPAFGQAADPALSPDGRWLVFVHTYEGKDALAIVDSEGEFWPQVLVSGEDFYMQPTWHPDGKRLAWIAWNHPNMPWDGSFLRLGELNFPEKGLPTLSNVRTIVGDENTAIFQPQFSPDGQYLAYVSDASGWGQIYLHDLSRDETLQLTHALAEHSTPAWIQGLRRFSFAPDGKKLYFLRDTAGFDSLWQYELTTKEEKQVPLDSPYSSLDQISISPADQKIALIASGGNMPSRVITVDTSGRVEVERRSTSEELPSNTYATPQAIEWRGLDGGIAHGLFYLPQNERFEGIGLPPLVVRVHGGPTSQAVAGFSSQIQFFTSRGYAVLDVNYRGSTGYGREYMNALRGQWGVYDVQDSVSGARTLVDKGLVDGDRLVIMGGSAGGFTTLKALEDYPGTFKAGICLYGVSNQFTLAAETHKFEARYSDQLLGPLPEASDIYYQRSPIFFADKIKDPLAVFQGEIDQVVPRNQSDTIVESLERRGVPHIYHVYPGEGHGFRKSETIEHFYKAVEAFLKQYVIFA